MRGYQVRNQEPQFASVLVECDDGVDIAELDQGPAGPQTELVKKALIRPNNSSGAR